LTNVYTSKIWTHGQFPPDLECLKLVGTPDAAHFSFHAFIDGKIQGLACDYNKQKLAHRTSVDLITYLVIKIE
jgi:hypothetical protein